MCAAYATPPPEEEDKKEFTNMLYKALNIDIHANPELSLTNYINQKRANWLLDNIDENVLFSSRNLYNINVLNVVSASTYDMIDCELLIIDKNSMKYLNESL